MERRVQLIRTLRNGLGWVLVAAALALAATMILPGFLGFERYVITGGSMGGTYDRGSLLYSEVVAVDELRVGDVITYVPPRKTGVAGPVTHRIVEIADDGRGATVFRTKGDANARIDPWRFRLERPEQARASFAIPYLGYGFAALAVREVRMGVIGLPALLIAIALMVGHWRDLGREAPREATTAQTPTAGA